MRLSSSYPLSWRRFQFVTALAILVLIRHLLCHCDVAVVAMCIYVFYMIEKR